MQSIVSLLDDKISLLPFWGIILIYMGVLLVMAILAAWKKWLTGSGILGAVTLGFMVLYLGGFSCFVIFLFFFVSCSVLSKIKRAYNSREKKGSQRDLMQVIANGLPAVLALLLSRTPSFRSIAVIAFSASVAEAVADTFSSTFGIIAASSAVCGVLIMGCGDGAAAVVGTLWGKHGYTVYGKYRKSLEGSLAMAVAASAIVLIFTDMGIIPALIIGLVMAAVENISPSSVDNVSVPLAAAFIVELFVKAGV